jgi:hypothetical protein
MSLDEAAERQARALPARWKKRIRSTYRALGPIASIGVVGGMLIQLYVQYQTSSLVLAPIAILFFGWHYGGYGLVMTWLAGNRRRWYSGPATVAGLGFWAFDALICRQVLEANGSTDALLFAFAPFVAVLAVLPLSVCLGLFLQWVCRLLVAVTDTTPASR